MLRRVVTAVIALSIVAMAFYFDEMAWMLYVGAAFIAVMCVEELTEMMRPRGLRVYRRVAIIGVLLLVVEALLTGMQNSILVFGLCTCFALVVRLRGRVKGAWGDVSATIFSIAYVGIPMAALLKIFRVGREGEAWLLMMMSIIWVTDSVALLVGKKFGRIKLWPKISPGKTWEGSIGGTLGALVVAVVVRICFPEFFPGVSELELLVFTLLFSIIGQFGDLTESLLKRDVGVKDSGSEWTGHGGFLDMMDAVLFTAVPLLIYLELVRPELLKVAVS